MSAVRADAYGAGSLLVHQQLGAIALPTNPSNTQTLTPTINGTAVTITFVSSIGSTPGNVLIGGTAAATCANLIALLNQPQTSTSTGIALSAANQTLVGYLSWPLSGTTITPCSNNTTLYAPQTSFTASTTATGGSYAAATLKLYVEPGVFYIAGTRIIFAGGSTPAVTAPVSNPRIDVLSINSSGTLAWTTGTENASPVAPTYPSNQLPICELYNVVGETALYDNANQTAGQGYISNDVRTIAQPSMNWGVFSADLIPDADGTRNLGSGSFEWNNLYVKTGIYLNGASINSQTISASTAAQSISANVAVAAGYYQSDGGIKIDAIAAFNVTGSSSNYSQALTIGSNLNRLLYVVIVYRGNSASISSAPQFNGVSLTQIQNQAFSHMPRMWAGYLVAPATGTKNLTWAASGGGSDVVYLYAASLYQCAQSGQLDNTAFASDDSISPGTVSGSITPSSVGDFLITVAASTGITGGGLAWENNGTFSSGTGLGSIPYGDANKCFPLVPIVAAAGSAGNNRVLMSAIKPVTAATLGAVVNASASQLAATYADNFSSYRSSMFMGFAVSGVSAGAAISIVTGGVVAALSGLTAGLQYYLSNTGGAIATTSGTVTRKIGLAMTATALLITNIW